MLIRKNTKAFKTIREIITACKTRPDRRNLIRLYITKAGHSIDDRISVEGIQGDVEFFYELNYDAVWNNLTSADRQLHESDAVPGIYFFRSSNKNWDETPFEFDEKVKQEFASLPAVPTVRKKGKVEKFSLPAPDVRPHPAGKKSKATKKLPPVKKEPAQPNFKLRHKIHFTRLDNIVFEEPASTKRDVLEYYNKISDYMLPYLRDRAITIRLPNLPEAELRTLDDLAGVVDVPDWIQGSNHKGSQLLLCNDKDHLLWYAEIGCVEFCCSHSRVKTPDFPDYLVVVVSAAAGEEEAAEDAALSANTILSGLTLPSFVKTDGHSGFHIYVPLESKTTFEQAKALAKYLCDLTHLKMGELIPTTDNKAERSETVTMNYDVNEAGKGVVAPYSLVVGERVEVAAPILWQEVTGQSDLKAENLNTLYKKLMNTGDVFKKLNSKKVSAGLVLKQLDANYSFLF